MVETNEDHSRTVEQSISKYLSFSALRQAPKSVTGWVPDGFNRSVMATQQLNNSYCVGLSRMHNVHTHIFYLHCGMALKILKVVKSKVVAMKWLQ